MTNARLFIDLPLDPGLAKQIHRQFTALSLDWSGLKPVPLRDYHLTLKFLGDTDLNLIPKIIEALDQVKLQESDINLSIAGPAIFSPQQPRVLVLHFVTSPALQDLYTQIETVLFNAGIAHKDVRQFRPHLTLARIRTNAKDSNWQNFLDWPIHGTSETAYFELQESVLSKTGPDYNVLQTFDL